MIPERLKPLLNSLKNPSAEGGEFNDFYYKEFGPTCITLIEQGISPQLTAKFNTLERLEVFVLRAATAIETPTKAEREADNRKFLKEIIDEFIEKLEDIDDAAGTYLAGPIPYPVETIWDIIYKLHTLRPLYPPLAKQIIFSHRFKGVPIKKRRVNCYKEREQARKALYKWMEKHLKQSPAHERFDARDRLIRLFQEFLPEQDKSFFDEQINKMLKPFGKDLKDRSISARMRRGYE